MSSDTSPPVTDGGGAGDGDAAPASKRTGGGSFFKELPFLIVIAFLLALQGSDSGAEAPAGRQRFSLILAFLPRSSRR